MGDLSARPQLRDQDWKTLETLGYGIGKILNSGSFASIFSATRKGEPCAVKVLNLTKIDQSGSEYTLKFLPRELYILKKLKHPFLVTIYEIFSINRVFVLIFIELAVGGDLLDLLKVEVPWLTEARARMFFRQFGDAIRYLHSVSFAHRDIKCENILVQSQNVVKITDLGFARSCLSASGEKTLVDTHCGTRAYMGPEALKSGSYSPMMSDVWSCGVVLFVMLNNKLPFDVGETEKEKVAKRMLERKYAFKNKSLTSSAHEVIGLLLTPQAEERPTMIEIFAHPWFAAGPQSGA